MQPELEEARSPGRDEADLALAGALYERVRQQVLGRPTPLSTYRLQLHAGFPFRAAEAALPYLARLGVSEVYASPYLKASPGSTHGYDCVDHRQLNPEVGSAEEHAAFCAALRAHGLGQVLDVVPNHMGVEAHNALWFDVLENGPASRYAHYFDIDWQPLKAELAGKVLLPVLGDQYGVVLERGELKLGYAQGAFSVHYYERTFPVAPRQYARVLGRNLESLEARLGAEHPHLMELQSILTALSHLPTRQETEPDKVLERHREKEVARRRLAALVEASPEVAAHVTANVGALNGTPGEPRSYDELDRLLEGCSYRLAYWRVAAEEINYRRFFDVNGLAALRVEDPEVFEEAHGLVLEWLREEKVTGLRVDHPDGLFDPTAYFLRLQERYFLERARALFEQEGHAPGRWPAVEQALCERWQAEVSTHGDSPLRKALYVVVEKIQGGRERMPEAWAVHGTTGYRFANTLGGLLLHPEAEEPLTEAYHHFIGQQVDYEQLVYEKKLLILRDLMAAEVQLLAHELDRISEMDRCTRDFTLGRLRRALEEFIALFPVYRTYVDDWRPELDTRDVHYIRRTIARARQRDSGTNASLYDFLQAVLLRHYPEHLTSQQRAAWLHFAMRLQQVTGPVMAKALEDTIFYTYNRLVGLNEVGGEPERFGVRPSTFHLRNQERAERWPASLLTTSTHDTKRSEDVRARLAVLSELPGEWRARVEHWARLTARHVMPLAEGPAPAPNDVYLFFQTLVGAWPMEDVLPPEQWEQLHMRMRQYMLKAIKEAKARTSWTNPDGAYEEAVTRYVDACMDMVASRELVEDVRRFKRRLQRAGQHNALGQVLLKLASPGVADTYQGCELWDLSLVDPDNRRPVDFALRARLLEALDAQAAEDRPGLCRRLVEGMDDGRAKLFLVAEGLRLRRRQAELFRRGGYRALEVRGGRAEAAVALARELEGATVIAAAPRFTLAALESPGGLAAAYADTWVELPDFYGGMLFQDVFTGQPVPVRREAGSLALELGPLLASFPGVLLERSG